MNIFQPTISGSLFISGAALSGGSGHILTYNTSSGLVSFTSSNAIGGGGSSGTNYILYTTSSVIGDGALLSYDVTHNFGSRDVIISVYESGSNGESVFPTVRRTSVNNVRVIFNTAPSLAQYVVYVSYITIGTGTVSTFQSVSDVVGDTTTSEFDVVHGFGTRDLHVSVYESGSNGETVYTTIRRVNSNTVRAIFNTPPDTNEYVIYVSS